MQDTGAKPASGPSNIAGAAGRAVLAALVCAGGAPYRPANLAQAAAALQSARAPGHPFSSQGLSPSRADRASAGKGRVYQQLSDGSRARAGVAAVECGAACGGAVEEQRQLLAEAFRV